MSPVCRVTVTGYFIFPLEGDGELGYKWSGIFPAPSEATD